MDQELVRKNSTELFIDDLQSCPFAYLEASISGAESLVSNLQ